MILAIAFVVIVFLILPIAGMFTWHTQEMAKVKGASGDSPESASEVHALKKEVKDLREMITSLAINVENMKDNYVHLSALEDRIKVGE